MKESELLLNKALDYLKNLKLGDAAYNAKIQRLYLRIYESKGLILEIEHFADAYNFNQAAQRENGYYSIIDVYLIAVKKSLNACDKPRGVMRFFTTNNKQIK